MVLLLLVAQGTYARRLLALALFLRLGASSAIAGAVIPLPAFAARADSGEEGVCGVPEAGVPDDWLLMTSIRCAGV